MILISPQIQFIMNYFSRKFSALKELLYFTNWPILLVGRLPIFSNRFALYQKDSISFITDYQGGDSTGARHLLASNLYKDFIERIASKGEKITTLLDVGANNGGFILHLINRFPRQLRKIVAVEFNYRTYLRLHFNVLYNTDTDTDVELINAAAAGSDGWLQSEDN
ncbi:MAG: hypothetical protein EAZ91_14490 [Cytophagales bacterium]|nr:MAG: hypothetical protein EAZ91_14490 [Cytophagales bacterium]